MKTIQIKSITIILLCLAGIISLSAQAITIDLSTSGRLGFYIDYSERSSIGDHTFYVSRTHGTTGQVTVEYSTHGDAHTVASGTLTWGNGEADIKSFTVTINSKENGDHRMYVKLSNPTGGAVLHNGNNTVAYGVIDDGTIAPDSEAVFFDAQATSNGNGTQTNPYNNIYDAIANVGSKRYIYGKGTVTPDGTNTCNNGYKCITPPVSRSSEETRVYIRNWPGNTLVVDGAGAADINGFYTSSGKSYITYRGIEFKNLDVTGVSGYNNGAAIFHHYGGSGMINIELCSADNINGSTNTGAYMLWGVDGGKVWRSTSNNVQHLGDNSNQNTAGVFYYSATNLSIQRSEFSNSANGIFMKRMDAGSVLAGVSFNIIKNTSVGVRYGYGSGSQEPNYGIVRSNIFKNTTIYSAIQHTGASPNQAGKQWISNNVFDNSGGGDNGAIRSKNTYNHQIFNNIFYNSRKMWDMPGSIAQQSNTNATQVEYADYNHEFGTTYVMYEYLGELYSSAAELNAVSGFAAYDTSGDPLFSDALNDIYTLLDGSPCKGTGISNTDKGLYLLGIEIIGANGIETDLIFANGFE